MRFNLIFTFLLMHLFSFNPVGHCGEGSPQDKFRINRQLSVIQQFLPTAKDKDIAEAVNFLNSSAVLVFSDTYFEEKGRYNYKDSTKPVVRLVTMAESKWTFSMDIQHIKNSYDNHSDDKLVFIKIKVLKNGKAQFFLPRFAVRIQAGGKILPGKEGSGW